MWQLMAKLLKKSSTDSFTMYQLFKELFLPFLYWEYVGLTVVTGFLNPLSVSSDVSRVMFIHYMRDTGTLLSANKYLAVMNNIVNIQCSS